LGLHRRDSVEKKTKHPKTIVELASHSEKIRKKGCKDAGRDTAQGKLSGQLREEKKAVGNVGVMRGGGRVRKREGIIVALFFFKKPLEWWGERWYKVGTKKSSNESTHAGEAGNLINLIPEGGVRRLQNG